MNSAKAQLFRDRAMGARKRERTRGVLLDSAVSVFAEKGFFGAKIRDITNRAQLANGTFYNYYQTKDELLRDVATELAIELTKRINDDMENIAHGPTRVALATARLLRTVRQQAEWLNVLLEGVFMVPELQSSAVAYLKKDLELGTQQGHFSVTVDLLLINQILALINVGRRVDPAMSDLTIKHTCDAVLRVLGVPAKKAQKTVAAVLDLHLEVD